MNYNSTKWQEAVNKLINKGTTPLTEITIPIIVCNQVEEPLILVSKHGAICPNCNLLLKSSITLTAHLKRCRY